MSSTGQSANQYWSLFAPRKPAYRQALRDGAQTKFGGENKPSGGTGLYYSEAKLLIRSKAPNNRYARGRAGKYPFLTPIRSEAHSPGKNQTADLTASIYSIFTYPYPDLLAKPLLLQQGGEKYNPPIPHQRGLLIKEQKNQQYNPTEL